MSYILLFWKGSSPGGVILWRQFRKLCQLLCNIAVEAHREIPPKSPQKGPGVDGGTGPRRFEEYIDKNGAWNSGAKCNRAKQTGFARLCQAL